VRDTGDRRTQHAYTHAHARARFRVLMCTRTQACMTGTHRCMHASTREHSRTLVPTYTWTHAGTHARTHASIHTQHEIACEGRCSIVQTRITSCSFIQAILGCIADAMQVNDYPFLITIERQIKHYNVTIQTATYLDNRISNMV